MNPAMTAGSTAAMSSANLMAAAAVAMAEEEEILTYERTQEPHAEMEFKIMRGDFSTQEDLEQMLEEQSPYGWVLLEVFDHRRVRLKRSANEAAKDRDRPGNPYETSKPIKLAGCTLNAIALFTSGMALFAGAVMLMVSIFSS